MAVTTAQQDKEASIKHHGEHVVAEERNLLKKLTTKDKSLNKNAVDEYYKYWTEDEKKNLDTYDAHVEERRANASYLTNKFYDLVTDFYEYGWCESFHFARAFKYDNFMDSIKRHEHYIGLKLALKPGMKVLDVGCGVGGPLRELVRFTGAHITGLNNNDYQIERARNYSEKCQLQELTDYVKGDFLNIPLNDNTFDAVYSIEATCHARKLEDVYGEIFRVLKPGCQYACYEWCMTAKYDPTNPDHKRVALAIEEGNGISHLYTTEECLQALRNVGFEVIESEDVIAPKPTDEPWYKWLQGSAVSNFRMSAFGAWCTMNMVNVLEKVGIAAPGSTKVSALLYEANGALQSGGSRELFTPSFLFVARKPESSSN
ncbi:Delta(24)-sterol C-methyltransferase [Basidiobolus ranarum]|uniref:Sterol 24-C-methyltransferase n=1 Tax=Basidiobolus ranarum TaxID=34480 RepID=A0ABR2WPE8_9FUNG